MKYQDRQWDFLGVNTKEYTHGFHTYPAMMIPQIARKLIEDYTTKDSKILFDPYMGSGTSLIEASIKGLEAIGTDLNPLARLISKAKSIKYSIKKLENEISKFEKNFIESNDYQNYNIDIPNFTIIDTWFKEKNKIELGYIKGFIDNIKDEKSKLFFLVAFTETVRKVSLTRNDEFKLYRIAESKRDEFNPETFKLMLDKLKENLVGAREYNQVKLNKKEIKIFDFNTSYGIPEDILQEESVDIVVTSPPYGDSGTTVAYGQFSRLANEWLEEKEAVKVDSKLMGGKKSSEFHLFDFKPLDNILMEYKKIDEEKNKKRALEVINFYDDYLSSINNVAKVIKKGGVVAYVVGNRRVYNIELPTDEITRNFFERNGFSHVQTIIRNIPNKRMPSKTNPSNIVGGTQVSTMTKEYIVILKKEKLIKLF